MKFFETIRIEDGIPQHLSWHQERMNHTRKMVFGIHRPIDIQKALHNLPKRGLYRAKVIYDRNHIETNYIIYRPKIITSLKLLETDISYRYKALDREEIESLRQTVDSYDDILMVKDRLLTDTTIANIALRQKGIWYTPATPLLLGTTSSRLLDEGKLRTKDIAISDIMQYDGLALMNAMIGFYEINIHAIRY